MAGIDQEERAFVLKEFNGLRNDVPEESFDAGDLSSAVNIEIDNAKRIRRRSGYGNPLITGANEWLWTDKDRVFCVRSGTTLVELKSGLTTFTTLRSDLTPGLRMVYTNPAPGFIYYSNGAQRGAIVRGTHRTWGLDKPIGTGTATALGGSLPAGTYRHLVTFVRLTGEESGAPVSSTFEVLAGQGIKLVDIPISLDPGVVAKKVYFSTPNGELLYWVGTIPPAQTDFLYLAQLPSESTCQTEHLGPPPAAFELTSYSGWIFAATDHAVRVSEPYQWDLWDPRKGFNTGTRPLLLAAVNDGVYLGTESYISYMAGKSPDKMEFEQITDYGVIPGTVSIGGAEQLGDEKGPAVIFATQKGICVGLDGGRIKNVTRGRFAYPNQQRGASVVRTIRGVPQFVVTLQGTEEPSSEAYSEQT